MERSLYPDVVRHYYPNGWSCPSDCHLGETWKETKGADPKKDPEGYRREKEREKFLGVTTYGE